MPVLQSLHEKYKDKGFVMIGIDPIDHPDEDEMADFLAKRGITYTILFAERELSSTYRVSGYPTLYFLDREGKIAKMHIGFGKGMDISPSKVLNRVPSLLTFMIQPFSWLVR